VRHLLPCTSALDVGRWHRRVILRDGIRKLQKQPQGSIWIWRQLIYGWGNKLYSSRPMYLDAVAAAGVVQRGPILECGSGLTTLVLATVAQRTGSSVWTLENDAVWFHKVTRELHRLGLAANVELSPLRDYGDFEWYDIDSLELPMFSLVICDGPSASTRGGRYGLLPVLGERLLSGCTVLLDDAGRPGERGVLRRWKSEVRLHDQICGGDDPYAVVTLG
jgi:hypothetical protein